MLYLCKLFSEGCLDKYITYKTSSVFMKLSRWKYWDLDINTHIEMEMISCVDLPMY